MPKSAHTQSPPQSSSPAKLAKSARSADAHAAKMSDVALRKKKNADAQAAFRARRANYISTLEETVTSLEAVVVQLQDSCRESRNEVQDLRQENGRLTNALETLRHESREREKYLRALWHARKTNGNDPQLDDFPPAPASFQMAQSHAGTGTSTSSLAGTPVQTHTTPVPYPTSTHPPQAVNESLDPRLHYPAHDPSVSIPPNLYHDAPGGGYGERSPTMSYINHEGEPVNTNDRSLDAHRMQKMGQYPAYALHQGGAREGTWSAGPNQAGPSGAVDRMAHGNGSSSHSPVFMPSPQAMSNEVPYPPRYPMMESSKSAMANIDNAPYIMGSSERSISPAISSPHNSSSTSINSQFQFVFPTESQERGADVDYQRHYPPSGPEMTLHGGTADVSGYALNRHRPSVAPERPMLGGMPAVRTNEQQAPPQPIRSPESTSGAGPSGSRSLRRSRRNGGQTTGPASSHTPSRSPSPTGHHPISSTLAVIKAQAFGALRRTRARSKNTSENASKVAMEVLEARGIGIGLGLATGSSSSSNKRPRLHDNGPMQ